MEIVIILFVVIVIGTIIRYSLFYQTTRKKFQEIGNMTGMSKEDVISKVGQPTSYTAVPDGQVLQWMDEGYHISILFDVGGKFIGINHEANVGQIT